MAGGGLTERLEPIEWKAACLRHETAELLYMILLLNPLTIQPAWDWTGMHANE